MTEEQIKEKHASAVAFVGQKVYQLLLPLIEINEALHHILALNREMYQLKNPPKPKEGPADGPMPIKAV